MRTSHCQASVGIKVAGSLNKILGARMKFLALLMALALIRWTNIEVKPKCYDWFSRYWSLFRRFDNTLGLCVTGVIGLMAIPVVTAIVLVMLGNVFFSIPALIINLLILYYGFGPHRLHQQAEVFLYAKAHEDVEAAAEVASALPTENHDASFIAVVAAIHEQYATRLFVTIFWFCLLGPVLPLLYRLNRQVVSLGVSGDAVAKYCLPYFEYVQALLDWIPIRILSLTYVLGGHFSLSIGSWWDGLFTSPQNNAQLLQQVASSAMGLPQPTDDKTGTELVRAALALVDHSLAIFVVIYLLVTLL